MPRFFQFGSSPDRFFSPPFYLLLQVFQGLLRKHYYRSIQRQSRGNDHNYVLDTINAAGMNDTYGTYVDDECFDIHDYDEDTDHDTDELTMILMVIMIRDDAENLMLRRCREFFFPIFSLFIICFDQIFWIVCL